MSKYVKITILIILLGFLILPQVASAKFLLFNFSKDSLVPCGTSTTPECNLCHVFKLIQNVIGLFLSLMILIAPLMLLFGGFIMLSSSGMPEKVNHGKQVLTYTIIGIVIGFGAWMIVNTILVTVAGSVKVDGQNVGRMNIENFLPWNEIQCKITPPAPPAPPVPPTPPAGEAVYCHCQLDDHPDGMPRKYETEELCNTGCSKLCKKTYEGFGEKYVGACCLKENKRQQDNVCGLVIDEGALYCHCQLSDNFGYFNYKFEAEESCKKDCDHVCEMTHAEKYTSSCCLIEKKEHQKYICETEAEKKETTWLFQTDLAGTKDKQIADATTALTNFLNCFYEKAPENIGKISSITDIDIYKDRGQGLCDPLICKGETCSIDNLCGGSKKACDHGCNSCHYGGTCDSTKSYAVDFGDEENACQIADIAYQCGGVNKIYGPQSCGGKVEVDGHHSNHVHISVINSCDCN